MTPGALDEAITDVVDEEVEAKPLLRGVSHLAFGGVAVFAWMSLVVLAPTVWDRACLAVYMIGICSMLFFSSLMHRNTWRPQTAAVLLKLDLTGIFLAIAGTYTALVGIGITGWLRPAILLSVWAGALFGIAAEWLPVRTPAALGHVLYLLLGWAAVIALPAILTQIGVAPFVLVVTGGVLYTLGAVAHITKKPDPFPAVFGFHEVFHALTIAAAICHYIAVALIVFND